MSKTVERELTETGCHELLDHELDMVTGGSIFDAINEIINPADYPGGDVVGGPSPTTLFHERPHAGR